MGPSSCAARICSWSASARTKRATPHPFGTTSSRRMTTTTGARDCVTCAYIVHWAKKLLTSEGIGGYPMPFQDDM